MLLIHTRPRADLFFAVTSWEVEALRHCHRMVEDHLQSLIGAYEVDQRSSRGPAELELMCVNARVPPVFRNPILISAWALYEACLVETASYFQEKLSLPFSILSSPHEVPEALATRWRRARFIGRAKLFYAKMLKIDVFPDAATENGITDLHRLRNALVHGGGRIGGTKASDWHKLENIAERRRGLSLETGAVIPERCFVEDVIELVRSAAEHMTRQARQTLVLHGLDRL